VIKHTVGFRGHPRAKFSDGRDGVMAARLSAVLSWLSWHGVSRKTLTISLAFSPSLPLLTRLPLPFYPCPDFYCLNLPTPRMIQKCRFYIKGLLLLNHREKNINIHNDWKSVTSSCSWLLIRCINCRDHLAFTETEE
jgi:hypothetical protein